MPSQERVDYHNATSKDFMAKSWKYLADDDLPQASEKGWGAAAQMVKAVAESRDWTHNGHRQLHVVIRNLVQETGDREIRRTFTAANTLHVNFYEGNLPSEVVEDYLSDVEELLAKLEPLQA